MYSDDVISVQQGFPGAAVGHGVRVCAAERGGAANKEKETTFLEADTLTQISGFCCTFSTL